MSDTGAVYPSNMHQGDLFGGVAWTNVGNIGADDGLSASATITSSGWTWGLYAKGLGLSVPTTATIDGVVLEIEKFKSGSTIDGTVKLLAATDGEPTGTDKAGVAWQTSPTIATYGSSSDLWGLSLTPTWVNDADFGAVIAAFAPTTSDAIVDFMRLTVYYTDAASAASTSVIIGGL